MFVAAIFDMDGLLIDSERAIMHAWIEAASRQGVQLTASNYQQIIGKSMAEGDPILRALLGGEQAFLSARQWVNERLAVGPVEEIFPIKLGAREVLTRLNQAGIPCAVASSSSREEIECRLSAVGVLSFFQAVAGGDEVTRGKPDPAVYQLATRRLGVDTGRCIAFEDSENGARAALAAGLKLVLVPDVKPPSPTLQQASLHQLESLHDALPLLPRWFRSIQD